MDILSLIPKGRENAITRGELMKITGLPDREIRAAIKKLVRQGNPILSSSGKAGYWLSDSWEEINSFIKEYERRQRSTDSNIAMLRRIYNEHHNICTVSVRAHQRRLHKNEVTEGQVKFL